MELKEKELVVSNTTITYKRGGSGRKILFLHGAGGSDSCLSFCNSLSLNHDVILTDHPGFGKSETPEWLDNIHDMAFFYLDFLERMNLRNVHLVGQSLGGWIALEIAIRSTQRINFLTLIGSAGINIPEVRKGDLFMWDKDTRYRKMIYNKELAEKIINMPKNDDQNNTAIKNEFTTARLAWEPRFFDPNLPKWLHRINIPTQVIWGQNDLIFPLAYGEKLAASIPDASLSVIEDCGHLPQIEKPKKLEHLIKKFTEGVS